MSHWQPSTEARDGTNLGPLAFHSSNNPTHIECGYKLLHDNSSLNNKNHCGWAHFVACWLCWLCCDAWFWSWPKSWFCTIKLVSIPLPCRSGILHTAGGMCFPLCFHPEMKQAIRCLSQFLRSFTQTHTISCPLEFAFWQSKTQTQYPPHLDDPNAWLQTQFSKNKMKNENGTKGAATATNVQKSGMPWSWLHACNCWMHFR